VESALNTVYNLIFKGATKGISTNWMTTQDEHAPRGKIKTLCIKLLSIIFFDCLGQKFF